MGGWCRRDAWIATALLSVGLAGTAEPGQFTGASSASEVHDDARPRRPRIGLVLGGGGAKGAAHIGVLRVLEELRVPIDCVAGTSMGALVGAAFSAGVSPEEIERAVLSIDWAETVGGLGLRDRTPIQRKLTGVTYSNSLELGIGATGLKSPGGFIATQDVESEIWKLVSGVQFTSDFDELPIPFRAIATDMVAGEMVVLDSGDLSIAMRASMAIPGAFAPVVLDDKVLADGGMMRNLPVDVARDLCADVVIAVWFATPTPEPTELASAFSLLGRSLDVMINVNQRTQIESLSGQDVGIGVALGDIGSADFLRVEDAIVFGRAAAEASCDALLPLSVSEAEYRAWSETAGQSDGDAYRLAELRVVGTERVNPEYVRAKIHDAGDAGPVTAGDIAAYAQQVYALGDFERVDYRLLGDGDLKILEVRPIEKSWGPDFLRFDLGLTTVGDGDIRALLRADHDRAWVNARGGHWHNMLQLGEQSFLGTDFYQPLDVGQRFFVQPIAFFENELEDVYIDGDRAARYFVRELYGQVDFGVNFDTRAQLRFGLRHGWLEAELDTGIPGLPELERTPDTSLQLRATWDTRDSAALPTKGAFANLRYAHSSSLLDGEFDYGLVEGVFEKAYGFGGDSLSFLLGAGRTTSGEPPITQQFQLGGIRTFPGLRPSELRGENYWFAGGTYLWRLRDLQPLFGQALYAGLRVQAAEVSDRFDGVADDTLYGIAGSLTGRTPIGTFLLSLGYVVDDSLRLQFMLGRPMAEGSLLDEVR